MRQYGRRAGRCGGVVVLGLTLLVAILGGQVAVVSAQDVGGSDSASVDGSGSGSLALEAGVGASPSPTPTPAPTYVNDDCSACCQTSDDSASVMPACCSAGESLFSTNKGYCSGLPCCTYGGREAQGTNAAWYPCAIFPTCFNDESKKNFCTEKNFTEGAGFQCTDSCCSGPLLETNVWAGVNNAYPGNNNASFSVSFNPSELRRVFFNPGERDAFKMLQIVLASPPDYKFGKHPTCVLEKMTTHLKAQTTCSVDRYNGTTHLLFDIPEAFQTNETFTVTFDHVVTPTGVSENTSQIYAAGDNLAPVYFMFTSSQGYVFSTFYRVTPLQASSLTSGSFVPENIYPGNTGNATLSFYSNTQVAKNSVVRITFGSKWLFPGSPSWKWEVIPETEFAPGPTLDELLALEGSESGSGSIEAIAAPERAGPKDFSNVEYDSSSNRWYLTVSKEWQPGWIILAVDQVQNPAVAYSGLNLATIDILDSKGRTLSSGMFSAISVELVSEPIASPYNYVTIVVLIGTLLFCTVVIRGNGLSFSLGSIWTDITAICTVLALVTSIVNNLVWALVRSSVYFYISRIFLCFTFTMLTAVCFHWGTVLSLHLRRLPKLKTVIAFVSVNLAFYIFQAVFLFYHEGLIQRVYDSENDSYSYANQQCKDDSVETSNSVFSEIQGYLWSCYAENEDKFFLVSTTVTSALFLGLTVVVMALGLMVMRRGRLLVGNSTGPHQIVLIKALRLYYTLIGIVTIVYLLSWVVQLVSRSKNAISYPWFYIFTVWLPQSIPPCCLIFLQWNSTAKSLKDADYDPTSNSVLSEADIYDEIRTPSFAFSSLEKWSDDETSDIYEADDRESIVELSEVSYSRGQQERPHNTTLLASTDDFIGLSMSLETNEEFPHGCFVAIQRLVVDPLTGATVWRQISNTDTAEATRRDFTLSGTVNPGRHVYSFMSVPRIPLAPDADDRVRLVVYSVNTAHPDTARPNHHSEMTAEAVLAAMERRSSGDDGVSVQTSTCDDSVDFNRSRVIDELFEQESEPDSTDGLNSLLTSLSIVAEFTVSTDVLVTSSARSEQVVLIAAEHSYKQIGLNSLPPKMSVHTVLPKAARTKYGLAGVASGLSMSHSISSQYHIRELGLLVVEDLTESRFSNLIPRQILEIILRYRSKQFLIAQNDLARLEAFDRQRQKGTDRGIYENLIQQIQDDGDISRCRDWMILRCKTMKDYIELLQRLRRVYVTRDNRKEYFKASTDKKNALLRFLPINLHLQDMWVGSASSFNSDDSKANVYDIVTVGAMAAHVYKFKNGGLLGLEEQRTKMKSRRREAFGSTAARRQSPMWTEEEQKAENLDWDIQKRMDVCFPQAVAALVTAFTRKIDLALQNAHDDVGREMLEHMEKLGFLFNVESLVSTHGNEAGMLEDMAGALNQLRNVRFVLVDEEMKPKDRDVSLSFDIDEEMKDNDTEAHTQTSSSAFDTNGSTTSILSGVVDVNVFSSLDKALADDRKPDGNLAIMEPPSPASVGTSGSSFSAVGSRLINTFIRAKSGIGILGGRDKNNEPSSDGLFGYTSLVIRVKVRTSRIKLPGSLPYGGTISVIPVLFTQGINEKQTIANNTGSAVTRLQDTINENSLKRLRIYADRYCNYIQVLRTRGTCPTVASSALSREQVTKRIAELDKLINSSKQARKKRPEILQLSSDLCRAIGAGRVTVCKSAKDRTGMSVTLEQGRILVQKHGLPESKKADIVSVMRSEGVRIENALKNTGRRVFAFNALQRSLLPEEYRCPPQTAGKNVS